MTDGNGNSSTTFTDRKGRQVAQLRPDGKATLYGYDDKDRLNLVMPPDVPVVIEALVYRYTYDGADNVLSKKIPGMDDPINYVHDARDLPLYMQDPNMAGDNRWLQTKYDSYGRIIQTGFTNDSGTPTTPAAFDEWLTSTTYYGNGSVKGKEGKIKEQYTKILGTTDTLKSFSNYDVYGRMQQTLANNHLDLMAYNTSDSSACAEVFTYEYDFADNVLFEERIHGYNNSKNYLTTTNQYDDEGRLTKTFFGVDNMPFTPTTEIAHYSYTFKDELQQKRLGLINGNNYLQQCDYTYNAQSWLTAINPALSGKDLFRLDLKYDNPENLFGSQQPDYAGNISQLIWQTRGSDAKTYGFDYDDLYRLSAANYFEYDGATLVNASDAYNTSYAYDALGNITKLNRSGLYEEGGVAQTGLIDSLSYTYFTNSNRLQSIVDATNQATAKLNGFNPGTGSGNYTYDANGNLTTDPYKALDMTYNFLNLPQQIEQDTSTNLNWLYDAAGNKLRKIVQGDVPEVLLVNGNPIAAKTYEAEQIEATGTVEANSTVYLKASEIITLNSPFETEANVDFRAEVVAALSGSNNDTVDYLGGIEYHNGQLEAIYFSEGRIYYGNGTPRYEYYLKDHLGNTRMVFTADGDDTDTLPDILQEAHYYPFGLAMDGEWNGVLKTDNDYLYNGKELNEELGLNWLDYGARWYDPSIGRWNAVDPLAESTYGWTPYRYGFNNPIRMIDPSGLTERTYTDGYGEISGAAAIEVLEDNREEENQACPLCPIVKGAAGAAIDYLLQGTVNYVSGMNMEEAFAPSNIDLGDVAISGLQGAFPWSTPGGKYGKAAFAALSDVILNYGKASLNGEEYTNEQIIQDFLVGFFSQLGADKIDDFLPYQRYEIAEGVKRAKAAYLVGRDKIKVHDHTGKAFKVRVKDLRSPLKSEIDLSSSYNQERFSSIIKGTIFNNRKIPPIYVHKGSRGTKISNVKIKK